MTGSAATPGRSPGDASPLDDGAVGLRFKGLPPDAADLTLAEIGAERRNLFAGGFTFPALVLREAALRHNAALMARYTDERGLSLAPHLKTTSSPDIARYALDEGAWGVTVATPFQARVFMAAGCTRVLLANQLVDRAFAREAAAWLAADDEREFYCYVDSAEGAALLADAFTGAAPRRPLPVLVELGHEGGRGGCRTGDAVRAVAEAVRSHPELALAGVSGYEGSVSHSRGADGLDAVRAYLRRLDAAARTVAPLAHPALPELVVSAGGSLYFDLVAEVLTGGPADGKQRRVVARPGAYLTHDEGLYHDLSPLDGDAGSADPALRLLPAIEVWAPVLTRPEPGLVILGAGRRDLNFDEGMPTAAAARDHRGGAPRPLTGCEVTALNDQHAYLRVPASLDLSPGDLVRLGISHPCTAHDRWLTALIATGDDTVSAVARCYF
ncbi:D-serine deaminase-like pyridoxal phosphate-dependent protein [Murinocardiopsis flavida]|uniref:D-serine deaminase-like pyridoxal phosphate-dependent protein n=1 Tax=Murinocardiopsis flavida TaxID=645275 RepID=A0A2P8D142_9ACTN|nr:alanine racemase [Murinocardiopsis flavida]PSK90934.1 D-serine deaminase-like pyridoxal phosphate-dependent protein [Murinocardiopsis flavida]